MSKAVILTEWDLGRASIIGYGTKPSKDDRLGFKHCENIFGEFVFTVAGNQRSKKPRWVPLCKSWPTSFIFFTSVIMKEVHELNEEDYSLLSNVTPSNNVSSLHSATILNHTIACLHMFFSEAKHC